MNKERKYSANNRKKKTYRKTGAHTAKHSTRSVPSQAEIHAERPSRTRPITHSRHSSATQEKPRKQNFIARLVNQWFDRVVGAMKTSGLSEAEAQYAPHRTTRDFVWNSIGSGTWGMVFPIVTMVSTQLVGAEEAGMISMAFVIALLLMFVGNFGVRTFQISDLDSKHSFKDYQANRWITCILMLLAGWAYCHIRGYTGEMFNISMAVIIYRFVDALADVYEGRLQQVDKLYLAGVSQTLRSVLAIVLFSAILAISRNATAACFGMAIAAALTFVVVTWPLTLMEAPPSKPFSGKSLIDLFKVCAPLFLAIFFFNLIEQMPKFFMESMLPYDYQLYYNAIYFPAQLILICAQLVYKPMLLRMAGVWQDSKSRRKFNLILLGIFAIIVGITAVSCLIMAWFGINLLSFLYGVDFHQFRGLIFLMLITGGLTAIIDFLYQVITIMRRQKDVTVLYLITFGFSLFIPFLLVHYAELEGAVLSYVIIECILCVLLVWEYFRIRMSLHGKNLVDGQVVEELSLQEDVSQNKDDGYFNVVLNSDDCSSETPQKNPRPSEIRAERQHREDVMRRRTGNKR